MGRMIDADVLRKEVYSWGMNDYEPSDFIDAIDDALTVEAIPKEEVRQFIENIQKIKDNHNEYGEPINYGTICGILIEGYRLLDKYKESKDGNDNCN